MAKRSSIRTTSQEGVRGWNFGAFAFLLILTTLFLMSFILTEYKELDPLFKPSIIIMSFGAWGLVLGFTTMTPRFGRFVFGLSFAVVLGILGILILSLLSNWLGAGSAFGILGVPSWVGILLVGCIGVLETVFWLGLYAPIRRFWAKKPKAIGGLLVLMFIAGVAWHQAVARTLFQGPIFDQPGYAFFVGGSWVLFALLFEATRFIDVALLSHFFWNVGLASAQGV